MERKTALPEKWLSTRKPLHLADDEAFPPNSYIQSTTALAKSLAKWRRLTTSRVRDMSQWVKL
jgi:hypothetical protein